MKHILRSALLFGALLFGGQALAAVATIYVDTGGCQSGSTTRCSGTTDSASATASGAAATITCSATAGPASAPGCSISGSAGQLSTVAVDGSQALFINGATNTNQKIFFINSVDDGAGLVGTTVTPTGLTATSSDWGIGGRYIMPSGTTVAAFEAALRAGDTVQFNNTPATRGAATYITARTSGDAVTGPIRIIGKSGVRPVLQNTGNSQVIGGNNLADWWIENLELKSACTSAGSVIGSLGNAWTFNNLLFSSTGSSACAGIVDAGTGTRIFFSEFSGLSGDAIQVTANTSKIILGNYIHGNTGNGITISGTSVSASLVNNVISANTGRGIFHSAASTSQAAPTLINASVIYNNGNSGLEVSDADTVVNILNTIFMSNGDAAGEYNVEWAAGSADVFGVHINNLFYHANCQGSNTGGPACVSGLTVGSTEVAADPQFVNAAGGNFALGASSPARQVGYPGTLLNLGSTGYMSIGAFQPQATSGGGCGARLGRSGFGC